MKKNILVKTLAIGVIILFFGASAVSSISGNNPIDSNKDQIESFENSEPMNVNKYCPYLEIETTDILTYIPIDDTYVVEIQPYYNVGSVPYVAVRNSGPGNDWEVNSLIRYDLSEIPSGTNIVSADLNLYYYTWDSNNPSGREYTMYRITSDWNEDTTTWNTRPDYHSEMTSSAYVPGITQTWMTWDVTDDAQDFINGVKENYGWQIMDEQYWGWVNIPCAKLRSKEYGNYIPYLTIENEIGEIFTFNPTDDTYVCMYDPFTPKGDVPYVALKNRYDGNGWETTSLIKFDISDIPISTPIISAKINLYYYTWISNNPSGREYTMYRITSDWEEETVTWNTRPSYEQEVTSSAYVPGTTETWMTWDVTSDVQKFVNGEEVNYGWQIMDEQKWGGVNIPGTKLRSKEYVELIPMFVIGRIDNLSLEGAYISFNAKNIRCIQVFPFMLLRYSSGEQIIVSEQYRGLITQNFVFIFCETSL